MRNETRPFVADKFQGVDHEHFGATLDDIPDAELGRMIEMASDRLAAVPSNDLYTYRSAILPKRELQ